MPLPEDLHETVAADLVDRLESPPAAKDKMFPFHLNAEERRMVQAYRAARANDHPHKQFRWPTHAPRRVNT